MKNQLIKELVDDAKHTILSNDEISKSLQKQQELMKNYGKKPLLFFRKYVGANGKISLADFSRVTFLSDSTVNRYANSSKKLVAMSRLRVAYGLMVFWNELEQEAYQDLRDEMGQQWYDGKIRCMPLVEDMKRMAEESLWKEYHDAFHEDAEMAKELAANRADLVRILYNYRYKKVPLKTKIAKKQS